MLFLIGILMMMLVAGTSAAQSLTVRLSAQEIEQIRDMYGTQNIAELERRIEEVLRKQLDDRSEATSLRMVERANKVMREASREQRRRAMQCIETEIGR